MRQNYEYLARIFCRRIRRHWLWNYPWALEFVCEQHEGENTMFGCTGFSKMIRHSLVSTKLRRALGYEEAGWYWEDVLVVIRQHTTQYWAVTLVYKHKHIKLICKKHACVTIAEFKTRSTCSPLWYLQRCVPHFYINRPSIHFDNLRQLNAHVKCSLLSKVSVSWGLEDVHVRSGWLIHLARLQYSHAPPSKVHQPSNTPFHLPCTLSFSFTWLWCIYFLTPLLHKTVLTWNIWQHLDLDGQM